MGLIRKTESWTCTDGEVFSMKRDASFHQRKINLEEALEEDHLLGNCVGCYVNSEELISWISDHHEVVSGLLESIKIERLKKK